MKNRNKGNGAMNGRRVRKKSSGSHRGINRVVGVAVSLLIVAYIITAFYFGRYFYPNTSINGEDFSNADQVAVLVSMTRQGGDYCLQVYGRDPENFDNVELFQITSEDVNLTMSVRQEDVKDLLRLQKSVLWPVFIWGDHTYTLQTDKMVDEDSLGSFLETKDCFREEHMTDPEDAYIEGYSETKGQYVTAPEVIGSRMQTDLARESIYQAILQGESRMDLEETGCYSDPAVTAEDPALQQAVAEANKWLETEITYDWNGTEVVLDEEQIREWISLKDNKFSLDEEAVAGFVADQSREYDTYGKYRTFHTTMGYDLKLPGGAFGWLTDRDAETEALIGLIEKGTVGEREPVYASKGPWKGTNDIGNTYVEADMTHQHLYLYQKGAIVLETDFVSGDMSKGMVTPEGVFGLTYKTTNAVLRGADYVTPVNYWMPFNGNVGMHDATWRDTFGGDIYLNDGSHGCLNLPLDKAEEIYQYMTEGFPIICYYYPAGVLPEAPPQENWDDDED